MSYWTTTTALEAAPAQVPNLLLLLLTLLLLLPSCSCSCYPPLYHCITPLTSQLPPGAPILTCPLTHVTPADGSCGPSGDVLQAVTTAPAATVACTGSHWTMLYGDNADVAASSVCALLP